MKERKEGGKKREKSKREFLNFFFFYLFIGFEGLCYFT